MDTTAHLPPPPAEVELSALADVVWAERAALEQLAFKLVALKLVLSADLRRFVGRCLDEVDAAWELVDRLEGRRALTLAALCVAWSRRAGALGLDELAAEAPEPWATVFSDHRDHLRALTAEIEHTCAANAELCAATIDAIDDDLDGVEAATRRALENPRRPFPAPAPLRLVGARPRTSPSPTTSGSFV